MTNRFSVIQGEETIGFADRIRVGAGGELQTFFGDDLQPTYIYAAGQWDGVAREDG